MDTSNSLQNLDFEPGDYLAREKSGCDAMYIIKEGQLEVYRNGKNGEKIPLGIINSGEFVGETALLMERPFSSNVVALTKVKAVKMPKAMVTAQLNQAPKWLVSLTKGLILRLGAANDVLRRNGLVDEKLSNTTSAISSSNKKAG